MSPLQGTPPEHVLLVIPPPITRRAVNSAAASENRIHSDEEARRLGYRAALVPGVTLYAYLTQLALPAFGATWLERGAATVRLLRPVYEGELVTCTATAAEHEGLPALSMTCARADGTACAEGLFWLLPADAPLPDLPPLPDVPAPDPRAPLTPDTVPLGRPLAPFTTLVTEQEARAYADETDDPSPWYRGPSPFGPALVPPGVLAGRQARLLRHNFSFGPSIHTASEIRHLAPAPVNATYRTGGVIRSTFERNGHHYLLLEAVTTADDRPVVWVRHTSIFRVRGS